MNDDAVTLCQGPLIRRSPTDPGFRIVLRASVGPDGEVNKYAVCEMAVADGKATYNTGNYFTVYPFSPAEAEVKFNDALNLFYARARRTGAWLEYRQLKALATPPEAPARRRYRTTAVEIPSVGWHVLVRQNGGVVYSSEVAPTRAAGVAAAEEWLRRADPLGEIDLAD